MKTNKKGRHYIRLIYGCFCIAALFVFPFVVVYMAYAGYEISWEALWGVFAAFIGLTLAAHAEWVVRQQAARQLEDFGIRMSEKLMIVGKYWIIVGGIGFAILGVLVALGILTVRS